MESMAQLNIDGDRPWTQRLRHWYDWTKMRTPRRHSTERKSPSSVEQLAVSPRPRVFLYSHDDTALVCIDDLT